MWDREETTAADVRAGLPGPADLARTTVATMLSRMEQYGWLTRVRRGRGYAYRAAISRADVRGAQVRTIIRSLFPADLPALFSHALREGDWEEEDLHRIEEMIRTYRERESGEGAGA